MKYYMVNRTLIIPGFTTSGIAKNEEVAGLRIGLTFILNSLDVTLTLPIVLWGQKLQLRANEADEIGVF